MSVTCGFYNSRNHDRRYSATQWGAVFDGLIHDGVYESIGTKFQVQATDGLTVSVGSGRGWFNHTWTLNDAPMLVKMDESDFVMDRIDAIVLEIDDSVSVRNNRICPIKGTPASVPTKPAMRNDEHVHQYPLAYITRPKNSSVVEPRHIENAVGTSACPYVTGIVKSTNIDNLVAQWEAQWEHWYSTMDEAYNSWSTAKRQEFQSWFDEIKGHLSTDAAGNLQVQINGKAPTKHDSVDPTYGTGSGTMYGHVKLSDNPGSQNAANGVAVTPTALKNLADAVVPKTGGTFTGAVHVDELHTKWLLMNPTRWSDVKQDKVLVCNTSGTVYYRTPDEIRKDINAADVRGSVYQGRVQAKPKWNRDINWSDGELVNVNISTPGKGQTVTTDRLFFERK